MTRWCAWARNGVTAPVPQPGDVFPHCTPRKIKCAGPTWVITAFNPERGDKDKPICETHMKESQLYHTGYLRATNTRAPDLPEDEWREFTLHGKTLPWENS